MAPSDPHLFVLTSHDIPSPWVYAEPSDLFLMSRHVQSDGMLVLKVVKEDSDPRCLSPLERNIGFWTQA